MNIPERIVPDEEEPGIVAQHLKRYEFARSFCARKVVLDAGCGTGYGTAYLGADADRVVGVDVSEQALAYARSRYSTANVEFARADLEELPFPDASFDTVVSFEAIEHLEHPYAFVEHAARVLRPGGTFVVSTPQAATTTHRPANPHHRVEFSRPDFERLLRTTFGDVALYGQRRLQTARHRALQRLDVLGLRKRLTFLRPASRLVGTPPVAQATLDDFEISPSRIEQATELIAVCRR